MPYVDLAGLSRYASRQKERLERDYAFLRDMQWTRSEKAGAVSLWPAGGTPLKPVVDFLFSETPPASGDKSPSNPSTITGVSSVKVTRCGKNLLPFPYSYGSRTISGVTFTVNADGSVLVNGTSTARAVFYLNATVQKIIFFPDTDYILHGKSSDIAGSNLVLGLDLFSFGESPAYKRTIGVGDETSASFTVDTIMYGRQYIAIASGISVQNVLFYPQLEASSSKTSYEKPVYDQYTLLLGSTYYGGTLDVASGVMTVTWWGEYVSTITNTELAPTYIRTTLAVTYGHMGSGSAPTYFRSNYDDNGTYVYPRYSAGTSRISISFLYEMLGLDPSTATQQTAKSAVESFLAQHPCFVVYRLYTPQTVQLTPTEILSLTQTDKYTPRLNIVYTDASAVQVGYAKSPIREEYELTQAITAQGGNV